MPIIDIEPTTAPPASDTKRAELPTGVWLFIQSLPPGTTARDLSAFFARSIGFQLSPENISCKEYTSANGESGGCSAQISLSKEHVAALLNTLIADQTFDGCFVVAVPTKSKREIEHRDNRRSTTATQRRNLKRTAILNQRRAATRQ